MEQLKNYQKVIYFAIFAIFVIFVLYIRNKREGFNYTYPYPFIQREMNKCSVNKHYTYVPDEDVFVNLY